MIGNPAPTLLGDSYYSIHLRNSYHGGMIICCTPLLYRWFTSHVSQSDAFWDVRKEPRWAPKITKLTHSDIVWYHRAYHDVEIIDSCGSFPNVGKFVGIYAIRIFMIGNLVLTLLGDSYYSIHLRDSYHGGMRIYCTPLLY